MLSDDERSYAAARLIDDVRAAIAAGSNVDFEAVMAANPQLMPGLRDALAKIARGAAPTLSYEASGTFADSLQIQGYSIQHELGRGGQAVVFLAVQKSTGQKVALKVLKHGPAADGRTLRRFQREVRVLAGLNHPNVVGIIDSGQTADGSHYIVMKYIAGSTLDDYIFSRAGQAATHTELLKMFVKICGAVAAAHVRGIVHRDLKPGNIRLDERWEPHVLDFGLARVPLGSHAISVTGEFLGSVPWSSPEQAQSEPDKIDLRSDIYSLGVILYQMVTGGRFPYQVSGNFADVMNNILHAPPIPPSKTDGARGGNVDAALEAIVLKALEKNPGHRFQSAAEFAKAVERYLNGAAEVASPQLKRKGGPRRRKPLLVGAASLVLFGTIGAGLFFRDLVKDRPGPTVPSDQERLQGKWRKENPISDNLFIEFLPDGTLTDDTLTGTLHGRYRLLAEKRMELDVEGLLWGRNHVIVRYSLEGDELLLTPAEGSGAAVRSRRMH